MFVSNIRFGLATNSSSSHSLVFVPTDNKPAEIDPNGEFGWNDFVLTSDANKRRYLATALKNNLRKTLPPNIAELVIRAWLGNGFEMSEDDSIDHQSLYIIPNAFGTQIADEQFFKEFISYVLKDNVAILGGNDNCDPPSYSGHSLKDLYDKLEFDYQPERYYTVCRWDSTYKFWTLFNPSTGSKLRFRFNDDKTPITKASSPELIDIKITDYCPFGCEYCYQGSTSHGQHAKTHLEYSWNPLYDALAEMKVFEVAIGGGEPTLHPHFLEILQNFRSVGITPNFTTRSIKWLQDKQAAKDILESAGSFAFSVSKYSDIDKLNSYLAANQIPTSRAKVHIVMGSISLYDVSLILERCAKHNIDATLLGYKNIGFGKGFKPNPYHDWIPVVRKALGYHHVAIDTTLAAESEKELLSNDVPKELFHVVDGKFSAYIDLVDGKIGPSSYEPHLMQAYGSNFEDICSIFQTF